MAAFAGLGSSRPAMLKAQEHTLIPGCARGLASSAQRGTAKVTSSLPLNPVCARSTGPGGNVMDRPTISPDVTKRPERRRRRPPSYRVLLHNDDYNRREYVVRVLLKVVKGFTVEDALNVMQEAHYNGLALVTVCAQDEAEQICEGMRSGGLISTIEPAGRDGT